MVLKNISLLPKSLILSQGWLKWNPRSPKSLPIGKAFSLFIVSTRKERWRGSEESGKQGGQMISKVKEKENVRDPPVKLFEVNQRGWFDDCQQLHWHLDGPLACVRWGSSGLFYSFPYVCVLNTFWSVIKDSLCLSAVSQVFYFF